jgi:hypothetical protein
MKQRNNIMQNKMPIVSIYNKLMLDKPSIFCFFILKQKNFFNLEYCEFHEKQKGL